MKYINDGMHTCRANGRKNERIQYRTNELPKDNTT